MTAEDRTRFEVLLENVQRDVRVIAEGYGALIERLDRFEPLVERRFEQIEIHVAVLDAKVNALETRLASLPIDTKQRLDRMAVHLGLAGPSRLGKRRQRGSLKRRKTS